MGYGAYEQVIVLGDGARWISAVQKNSFPKSIYVLDWYHLRRKVARVMGRVFEDQKDLQGAWRKEITSDLWEGRKAEAWRTLMQLDKELASEGTPESARRREDLQELQTYLWRNWRGIVWYGAMHEAGYMVASSLVEKAGDLAIAKRQKKRQGMHWSHLGADAVSALRTVWLNGDWNAYWDPKHRAA